MTVEGSEPIQGCDTRRFSAARVRTGMERSPVRTTLLETTVRRLNERGLALLTKAAQALDVAEPQASWREILPLWARASEGTLGRAARCPMVLLDFNFQRLAWWSRVIDAEASQESGQPSLSTFNSDEAISLARELLLEAWSAARAMPPVSSLVFGMAPEVSTLIARLSPRDLDRVVVHESKELRPRWENRPMFWKELFHAATQMDDQILANVHLHCLQLLGGERVTTHDETPVSANGAKAPIREESLEEN
jgi:hypothetical protein